MGQQETVADLWTRYQAAEAKRQRLAAQLDEAAKNVDALRRVLTLFGEGVEGEGAVLNSPPVTHTSSSPDIAPRRRRRGHGLLGGRTYEDALNDYVGTIPPEKVHISTLLDEIFGDTISAAERKLLWNGFQTFLNRSPDWERHPTEKATFVPVQKAAAHSIQRGTMPSNGSADDDVGQRETTNLGVKVEYRERETP